MEIKTFHTLAYAIRNYYGCRPGDGWTNTRWTNSTTYDIETLTYILSKCVAAWRNSQAVLDVCRCKGYIGLCGILWSSPMHSWSIMQTHFKRHCFISKGERKSYGLALALTTTKFSKVMSAKTRAPDSGYPFARRKRLVETCPHLIWIMAFCDSILRVNFIGDVHAEGKITMYAPLVLVRVFQFHSWLRRRSAHHKMIDMANEEGNI